MKFVYFAVITALLSVSTMSVFSADRRPPETAGQTKAVREALPLRLTTSVVTSRYCRDSGNDTLLTLRLRLRLRYTNLGQQSIILYKNDNTIARTMISRDLTEALNQRYLWDMSLTTVTGGEQITFEKASTGNSFKVITPGQFYEAEREAIVFTRRDDKERDANGLAPGQYFMQLSVSTWPQSSELARRLSERWQANGRLWFNMLKSEPMAFTIKGIRKEENCLSGN